MTEDELVDFETKMNKAITDTNGLQNVSVTRVGATIYVKDAEGRAIGASALTSFTSSALKTDWVNGYPSTGSTQPVDGTVVSGGISIAVGSQAGAVASESKFDLAALDTGNSTAHKITLNGRDFTFTSAATSDTTTVRDEIVTNMQAAFSAVSGYQNVVVTRDEGFIYVRDDQGRSIGSYVAGTVAGTYGVTAEKTQISEGLPPPTSTAVFSGSARLNDTQIKTQSGANLAISRLDNAMANVSQELATFGSVMNRLTYAGDNLTNVSQNTSFSRSRVLDTDYAAATTELARTQIIQQAGMAMLAQANQQPQTVLSLLQ
jgi:flagellin